MTETLKRTFHGCLTCRKRKVRCLGTGPGGGKQCQNCTRMNITCHSSFDTNLRIRVSTPTGQKVVDVRSEATREPSRAQKLTTAAPTPPPLPRYESQSEPPSLNFQQSQFQFSFPQTTPHYVPELPDILPLGVLEAGHAGPGISNLEPLHLSGAPTGPWAFDFSAVDPSLDHDFQASVDGGVSAAPVLPPIHLGHFLHSHTSLPHHNHTNSDSETSVSSSNGQRQDGTKEWVPRRRKRTKRVLSKDERAGNTASEGLAPIRGGIQEDLTTDREGRWSMGRFFLDYSKNAVPHCPVRLSVLAWTAKLSETGGMPPEPPTKAWYSQASDGTEKLMGLPNPTLEFSAIAPIKTAAEIVITTTLFLNRFDVLNRDLESAGRRIQRLARWLSKHPQDLGLSSLACKLLLWTAYLQVRLWGADQNTRCSISLLHSLAERVDYHQMIDSSYRFYPDMFGQEYPREHLAEDIELIPVSLRLHEKFWILAEMLHFGTLCQSRASAQNPALWDGLISTKQSAIDMYFQRAESEYEHAISSNPAAGVLRGGIPLGSVQTSPGKASASSASPPLPIQEPLGRVALQWLTAYAAFLAMKILWSRGTRPDIRSDMQAAETVEKILQLALFLRRSPGHQQLSPTLWPLPLLVAGIETVDEVRADWVRMFMSSVIESERARDKRRGEDASKVLDFMEHVRKRQVEAGMRVPVEVVIAELGGAREYLSAFFYFEEGKQSWENA